MLEWIGAVQPPLIAAVLLWSSAVKLFTRRGKLHAGDTALATLVGDTRAVPAYRAVGGIEALVAILLLAPPLWWAESAAVVALGIGFAGYLTYSRITTPEASCGCMTASRIPVSWRGFCRAGWLVVTGGLGLFAGQWWPGPIADRPLGTAGLLIGEAILFVVLSPEFDGAWLVPLRRLKVRYTHPLGGEPVVALPLENSIEQVHNSPVYRTVAAMLRSDVRETWDEGDWRIVVYGARYDDRPVTAVFAVSLNYYAPEEVRVAFVDDASGETVLHLDAPADTEPTYTRETPADQPATG